MDGSIPTSGGSVADTGADGAADDNVKWRHKQTSPAACASRLKTLKATRAQLGNAELTFVFFKASFACDSRRNTEGLESLALPSTVATRRIRSARACEACGRLSGWTTSPRRW